MRLSELSRAQKTDCPHEVMTCASGHRTIGICAPVAKISSQHRAWSVKKRDPHQNQILDRLKVTAHDPRLASFEAALCEPHAWMKQYEPYVADQFVKITRVHLGMIF